MEDKYGQVYPERAVAALRQGVERALASQQIPAALRATLEQGLRQLDSDGFPPDEPLFLLRGQDVIAPDIVRIYANERIKREEEQSGGGRTPGHGDEETHLRLYEHADRMAAWQPRKMPD